MNILITGGAGFIGSHVVDLLVSNGDSVVVFDDFSTGSMENLGKYQEHKRVEIVKGDVSSVVDVAEVFMKYHPETVIHLAAQSAISVAKFQPMRDLGINGLGTLLLLRNAEQFKVQKFIYASTSAAYQETEDPLIESMVKSPANYYGVSKYTGELYLRISSVPHTILRFGNVYGPRQVPIGENQVIPRMLRHLLYGDEFYIFGDGEQKRDFIYVGDVALAIQMAIYGEEGTYNIATGVSHSVNTIAALVADSCGKLGYEWPRDKKRLDPRRNVVLPIKWAEQSLRWVPIYDLPTSIDLTVDWWQKRLPERNPVDVTE